MTKTLTVISIAIGTFIFANNLYAQKLGHVNSTEILTLLPETKSADSALKKFGELLDSQLQTMSVEYQSKVQDYQSKESLMADAIKQTKIKDIKDLEVRIQEFQQTGQESLQNKKQELYAPVLKKVQDAINAIAKENAYTYIFDTSLGSVLYAQEANDVSALVKKKLNISLTATVPSRTTTSPTKTK